MKNTKKKILIVSLSAGAGHVKTAEALVKTAELKYPDLECRHIDMYNYITSSFKHAAVTSYDLLAKKTPKLWGALYEKTDGPKAVSRFNKITKQLKQINSKKLYTEIQKFKPDAIISTHFLPGDMLLNQPKKYTYSAPVTMLITDYDLHNFWVSEKISHYFVATEKIKSKLIQRGHANKDKVTVSGIPVNPKFYEPVDKDLLKKELELKNQPTILLLSGGSGLIKTDEIVKKLFSLEQNFNLVTIAGKNTKLEDKLKKITPPKNIHYQAIGWTDKMEEYIKLSDLVITKPGGLTTTECMVTGAPIIAIDPVPGQEEANAKFITENNLGWVALNHADVVHQADKYLKGELKHNQIKIKKPAGQIVLEKITNL